MPTSTKKAERTVRAGAAPERGETKRVTRRKRPQGEARRLLVEAAQELFTSQGYTGTSTRQISERADIAEPLIFRYFGSKVGLFREAVVAPFVEFVEGFTLKWKSGFADELDAEALTRLFIGDLFDLFRKNRGLVAMLWTADAQSGSELADSGVFDEINEELRVLAEIGTAESVRRKAKPLGRQDLVTRSTLAMVAGMAVLSESFYGGHPASREDIVEELTQAVLHGHLHRTR